MVYLNIFIIRVDAPIYKSYSRAALINERNYEKFMKRE